MARKKKRSVRMCQGSELTTIDIWLGVDCPSNSVAAPMVPNNAHMRTKYADEVQIKWMKFRWIVNGEHIK